MTHGAFYRSVLVALAILWSGCCGSTSVGSDECTWPGVQQETEFDETDGTYEQVGGRERFGDEKLSETSMDELSDHLPTASSSPAMREPLSMQCPVFVSVVLMSCCSIFGLLALFGRLHSQSQPATWSIDSALQHSIDGKSTHAERQLGQCSKSLTRDNTSHLSTDAQQEGEVSRSDGSVDCSKPMDNEVSEYAEESEFGFDSTCVYSKNSMEIFTQTDILVGEVEIAGHPMPCHDIAKVVDPTVVALVIDSIEILGREASEELHQNVDSHFTESPHGCCDVTPQSSEASEVPDQATDNQPNSRTSWVSSSRDAFDVICNDFAAGLITRMLDEELDSHSTESPRDICQDLGEDAPDVLEQNMDSRHFMESPHVCCDVAQSCGTTEVPNQETHNHRDSRTSWVSNCTEASDVSCNDFAAALITGMLEEELHSHSMEASLKCKGVRLDKVSDCSGDVLVAGSTAPELSGKTCEVVAVAAESEAQLAINKNMFVETGATQTLRCQLAEVPSPVRCRRPSASFESPRPARRRCPSASFDSPSPVRCHAATVFHPGSPVCTRITVLPDDDGNEAIAAEVALDATAELFRQLLGDSAAAGDLHKQGDDMTALYDHGRASLEPQPPVAASCKNPLVHFEQTTTSAGYKSVGAARDLKNSLERRQSRAHALDLTPSKQMERARVNSLLCSPASRCSLSPAVIDASAFSPGASEYKEPEAGSTHRLKEFFKMEVERCQSQAHALDLTPSKQMERTRRNSFICSPASRGSVSPAVIDASAFSPGASEYQEPEAGSTQKLKDLFERRSMVAGNPESLCEQKPTRRSFVAPALTDCFEQRINIMVSLQHVREQTSSKKSLAEMLRENED